MTQSNTTSTAVVSTFEIDQIHTEAKMRGLVIRKLKSEAPDRKLILHVEHIRNNRWQEIMDILDGMNIACLMVEAEKFHEPEQWAVEAAQELEYTKGPIGTLDAATIIARYAPLDVARSRNEYRDKFDAAFAEKIAAQNRIAELEAENARLREALGHIESIGRTMANDPARFHAHAWGCAGTALMPK